MSRIEKSSYPFNHFKIFLEGANDSDLKEIASSLGLGLSLNELRTIRDYYTKISREATDIELQTYDQTWSEHCFHKTFKGIIKTPEEVIDDLLKTYISRVVEELKPFWCYSVFEDNAGIVDFEDEFALAIKVETHNHPSAIEPFGGSATGIGGVIRDILGVWGDPIACTDVLCFGPLDYDYEKLPEGVKHPSYLFRGVIDGIGSYGNSIGIPTVNGATVFDVDYTGNVVVYAGCIGVVKKDNYIRNIKSGDLIILAGGRTGLDGIHGVTFASAELTEESEEISRPAVQIASPIEEEKIKRAIQQISNQKLGSGITDIGGGGLSCGVCEMADQYGLGAEVYLEKVPLKYSDMAPWEIWISESQERMLISVPPKNGDKVLKIFEDEQVEANIIGKFTDSKCVIIHYEGNLVARLEIRNLFDPPRVIRSTSWKPAKIQEPHFSKPNDLDKVLRKLLSSPNIASKEKVIRRYDHEVKGHTVIKPLQGWNAGPNDGAVLKPLEDSWRGVSISCGINSRYGKIDPYWMASSVIDEAVRNNVAMGGRRIALLDNFTWGNPEYEDRLGGLVQACRGCYDTAIVYQTPFISGKDSLYNESPLGPVAPTLLITAIGLVPDIRRVITMDLKTEKDTLYLIGVTRSELGGSEYYKLMNFLGASIPKVDAPTVKRSYDSLTTAIDTGLVKACHDLSEGGLGVAAAEMAFTGEHGLHLDLSSVPVEDKLREDIMLFSESNGRLLVEIPPNRESEFEKIMKHTTCAKIGNVIGKQRMIVTKSDKVIINSTLEDLLVAWKTPLVGSQ